MTFVVLSVSYFLDTIYLYFYQTVAIQFEIQKIQIQNMECLLYGRKVPGNNSVFNQFGVHRKLKKIEFSPEILYIGMRMESSVLYNSLLLWNPIFESKSIDTAILRK